MSTTSSARESGGTQHATTPLSFASLGDEAFISLTTFRRDGTPVPTPVWVAREDGRLLVTTEADSGKVKRLRRNRHVRVAACGPTGRIRGPVLDAEATVTPDAMLARQAIDRKYGWQARAYRAYLTLMSRLRRQPTPASVTLEIFPAPTEPAHGD